jgi:DNA-binding LytR/AlgR family response regulator
MKGTEFGLQLRRQMKNYDTQIVFISTIRDYAMELFKIRPIAFLIKPITYEDLCKCLQDYMLDYSNSDSFLEYISENTKHKIKLKEVSYLESNGKKVIFHTKTEEFAVNGKISSIIEGNGSKFLCISRGVYVNIKHIIKATSKEVTLEDGTSLFISRGQQSIVRDRLSEL